MTFELPRRVLNIPSPFLIACEGYSDLRLVDELLQHHQITNCNVGCPSRDFGNDGLLGYLKAIRAHLDIQGTILQGILVMIDADTSRATAFTKACNALAAGDFPVPALPFTIEEMNPRVAVYIMPGQGRDGTLEHLLLEAAYRKNPKAKECTDHFLECIGKTGILDASQEVTSNQDAKMRMSSLAAATCKDNPWASAAWIWNDKGNPVPIDSPCFEHLADFLRRFSV